MTCLGCIEKQETIDTLRAQLPAVPETIDCGDLHIDVTQRRVSLAGTPVELTRKEFNLLSFMACRQGQIFSRQQLLDAVWGTAWRTEATVTEHVRRLRLKVGPEWIEGVYGVGYCFRRES